MNTTRRAFTLIELLTVIAIIGILAAIIIPTTAKVRQTTRSAQCRSNMRQIALAVILHTNEQRNSTLPGPLYSRVSPAFRQNNKKGRLIGFLAPQFGIVLPADLNQVILAPAMVCPGFALDKPELIRVPDENAITYINNSSNKIIPDYDGTVWGVPDTASPHNAPVPLTRIPAPASTWMLADIDAVKAAGWGGWNMEKISSTSMHGSTRNRAYFDGHVSVVPLNAPDS
ncbi:type II secretion system protein [Geminisphaera colitermitum]|uniref:type II secretion system protein n=1 Tax=Geminisphaera colitermitum TaxID=1148786 RepID=UPI0001964EA4|nr:prepilin-type N-terminal cleavage/methylation domain-containing protein [Geminisphaera colitermitum]